MRHIATINMQCETCKHEILKHTEDPCSGCKTYSNWDQSLTLNFYQQATARTDSHTSHKEAVLNFALGIAGEAGEIVDLVKKRMFHGHEMDKEKLKNELGDQLWYIARMAARFDLSLEEVAQGNIDKLKRRYPMGFNSSDSVERRDTNDCKG